MTSKKTRRGYDVTYKWVTALLRERSFEEPAARLGLRLAGQDRAEIDFLGRTYLIAKDGITLREQRIPWTVAAEGFEHNLKSALGYYFLSDFSGEPVNDFCPLTHFSHGVFDNRPSWDITLEKVYGEDPDKLRRAGEALGFIMEKPGTWHYRLLPKMPVKIIHYEGDDEYPTTIQVLFDKTAIQVYKFEPLAVLYMCFRQGLAAMGKELP